MTGDYGVSLLSMFGSVIPDALEGHDYDSLEWRKRHRLFTHWLVGYIVLLIIIFLAWYHKTGLDIFDVKFTQIVFLLSNPDFTWSTVLYIGFYLIFGAILHILQDTLNGPVPLLNPMKKTLSLRLFKTGSVFEYLLAFGLLILALRLRGGLV